MKGSDKAVVVGVVIAVILAGFYLKVLSPKREKASKLADEITQVQTQVDEQKQTVAFGEAARHEFPKYYGRLVVLGKAVPDQADTASLMVQLSTISDRTGVSFDNLALAAGSSSSSAPAAPAPSPAPSSSSSTSTASTGSTPAGGTSTTSSTSTPPAGTTTPTTTAPATEASAANLPIGATVGPAGLPTMPYNLEFSGSYFEVADFISRVDHLVHQRENGLVSADGRLMTIDGFSLSPAEGMGPSPTLDVSLFVTSYVTPSAEGLTAGASPTGPAGSTTQPASQTVAP